jgi:hypothetical protein
MASLVVPKTLQEASSWAIVMAPLASGRRDLHIERADSLAFDFYKRGRDPYDAIFPFWYATGSGSSRRSLPPALQRGRGADSCGGARSTLLTHRSPMYCVGVVLIQLENFAKVGLIVKEIRVPIPR